MIRIVVADDNEVLLEHIVKGLKESDKLEVVGIANDGEKETYNAICSRCCNH